ncbi:Protein SPT2 [Orchesella cincta]|uniref:Protein SPT2 homolog n=1 Tax=Orchesella cincta TaxID=48709 RepID=A0A1D2MLN3_ORCCI|nr:Protein SPT2 [Orchesella cincta]
MGGVQVANQALYDPNKPRRVDPKEVRLKEGVAKFLAKREEEDRKKRDEERVKKEKLLQLRNQDRKAANRPDEDDYGYTSNYADMMHKKMMEKYKAIPVKPAFPQERGPPIPKPQTFSKNNGSGWRKSNTDNQGDYSPEPVYEPEPAAAPSKPAKPSRVPKPKPVDYQQLLELAKLKALEPALPTKVVVDKNAEREQYEFGRPMTAKEKAAFLAEKELKDKVARRMDFRADKNNNGATDPKSTKDQSFKIPKARQRDEDVTPAKKPRISESGDGKLLHRELSKSRPAEPSSHAARSSSPVRKPLEKPYRQSESAKPRERDPYRGNGQSRPDSRPQGNPDRQSGERSRGPPSKDRVNVDQNRKPASPSGFKQKPGPSRESLQSGLSDSRENARMGMSSMKNNPQRDSDRRPIKKDAPPVRRDDVQNRREPAAPRRDDSQQRRDDSQQRREAPTARRDESQYRKETPASRREEVSYRKDTQQSRRDGPPSGRSEMQPQRRDVPTQRRDMPPQRRDNIPPQRKDNLPPVRREMPPLGRGDMGPPRRDAPVAGKRDAPPPRRDGPPPARRDGPMRGSDRMRDEQRRMKPRPPKGRAVIDSDEEYDSEMDDFIDDSELDTGNISAIIGQMFNYDRRKYVYEDSDDECMESSVAQQMREEQRSLRIGIQEDMEDIRREEEEKRRKMGKVKKAVR